MADAKGVAMAKTELTDQQWNKIAPLLPRHVPRPKGGRPPRSDRECFEGILWISAERRPLEGSASGISLAQHLLASIAGLGRGRGVGQHMARVSGRAGRTRAAELGRDLCRRDIRTGKKRGSCVGNTKRGKGTKCVLVASGQGVPLATLVESATPAEMKLLERTVAKLPKLPARIIADRGYDWDPLRERLATENIDLIVPYRKNRRVRKYEDGRKLRRYKRRWIVERTFAWLGNFRRLVVRYERQVEMYQAFVHMACAILTLRAVLK